MKLVSVTKLDKENTLTLKNFDDDVILVSCDDIVIILVYGQIRAIRKLDSECMVCNTYILINSNLASNKN